MHRATSIRSHSTLAGISSGIDRLKGRCAEALHPYALRADPINKKTESPKATRMCRPRFKYASA
jgi:hypothetical protein